MTKQELTEYRELQKEIKRLKKRAERFRDLNQGKLADVVKGSSAEFPYTEHSIFIEGFDADKRIKNIEKLERILTTQISKSIAQTVSIAEFICDIESAKIRAIFEYRYYDLMTWQQIAFKIGVTSEAYPRNTHDKYLSNVRNGTKQT